MTSFRMQYEKIGCGLLQEDFWSEGEYFVGPKREGEINLKLRKTALFYSQEKVVSIGSFSLNIVCFCSI